MEDELLEDLLKNLGDDYEPLLAEICIKMAMKTFRRKRNYPRTFTEEKILIDMDNNYACIYDLALYRFAKDGGEFQTSHSENGITRQWESETEIFIHHGVFPFVG
ncbi:MAG: hypothetical protein KBT03_01415 [Bacteroidales bacterium]|nr:hypothetical protein [Candidatus Scybalousia scybalohippi]